MSLHRLTPLAGVGGILGVIVGLALDDFPDGTMDDAALAHWFDVHGTTRWMVSGVAISLGGALLLVFAALLAHRVAAAGAGPMTTELVRTAATAWGVLTTVGGALWLAPPVAVRFFEATPTAGGLMVSASAYAVLAIGCGLAASLLAAALAAAGIHTGLLPRWLAVAGIPASVLILANVVLPMAAITLWFGAVAISLVRRAPERLE
jgi:hypothetical protein